MSLLDEPGRNGYRVRVQPYAFGQYRIQLIDEKRPDDLVTGEGSIVRELCTYSPVTAGVVVQQLVASDDPEAHAETFAKPYNCEGKGGRIRLDNKAPDRA